MNIPLSVAILAITIILSAFFSATETAFLSLNKTKLKSKADGEKKNKLAKFTLKLSESHDTLISTILIGNALSNISFAVVGTFLFMDLFKSKAAVIAASIGILTFAILLLGEFTPKNIAKHIPEKFAIFASPIIAFFIVVLFPVSIIFSGWNKLTRKIFRLKKDDKLSQEELLMMVEEVKQDGSIDESEGDLIVNAIEFKERTAEEILTHRVELEAVDIEDPKEEIAKVFEESRFSRILVYKENIDNIIGVIHQKDFYVGCGIYEGDIKDIITPPVFIHKTEKISDLLKHLQMKKSHMAIVIDEYGGTIGIVTMEDILEELVGEIWDEHDDVVEDVQMLDKNAFLVDGTVTLDEFCEEFGLQIESESVSLGGFVMERLGKIPEKGDSFEENRIRIIVNEVESHRVESVKVIKLPPKEDESDDKEKSFKDLKEAIFKNK